MLKELFSVSVVSAFCAMAVMVLIVLFAGGGIASILYGGIVLPFAYLFALVLGFPLLLLKKYMQLNTYIWLLIYALTGLLGSLLVLVVLGINITVTTFYNSGFFLTYGPMGMAAAIGAWYFSVYRKAKAGAGSVNT